MMTLGTHSFQSGLTRTMLMARDSSGCQAKNSWGGDWGPESRGCRGDLPTWLTTMDLFSGGEINVRDHEPS